MRRVYKKQTSVNGVCCSCGYKEPKETVCEKREDETHCNHWWDGPDTCPKCDKELETGFCEDCDE